MSPNSQASSLTKALGLGILCALFKYFNKHKERDRYYLMPGMGGRALKRKHKLFLRWSLAIGVVTSLLLAYLLYILSGW